MHHLESKFVDLRLEVDQQWLWKRWDIYQLTSAVNNRLDFAEIQEIKR